MSSSAWERRLNEHQYNCLQAARTKIFAVLHAYATVKAILLTDDRADLRADLGSENSEVDTTLDELNVEKCQAIEAAMYEYQNAIVSKKGTGLDRVEWEQLLDDEEQKAIAAVTKKIKSTTQEAKEVIKALPASKQNSAANVYIEGSNIAMQVFNTMVSEMSKVSSRVAEFLKGIFTAVENASNAVKNAATDAINYIKGLSSLVIDETDSISTVAPAPSIPGVFYGNCTWPATATMTMVTLGVSYIVSKIAKDYPTVTIVETATSDRKGHLAAHFLLGGKNSSTNRATLEKIFNEVVTDWIKNVPSLSKLGPISAQPASLVTR